MIIEAHMLRRQCERLRQRVAFYFALRRRRLVNLAHFLGSCEGFIHLQHRLRHLQDRFVAGQHQKRQHRHIHTCQRPILHRRHHQPERSEHAEMAEGKGQSTHELFLQTHARVQERQLLGFFCERLLHRFQSAEKMQIRQAVLSVEKLLRQRRLQQRCFMLVRASAGKRQRRHNDPCQDLTDEQKRDQHRLIKRQKERADCVDDEAAQRHRDGLEIKILQHVDVRDKLVVELSLGVIRQRVRDQRLKMVVEISPQMAEDAKRDAVIEQPLHIAHDCAPDAEKTHTGDERHEQEHLRRQRRFREQEARRRQKPGVAEHRQRHEQTSQQHAPAIRRQQPQ